jgi:carbamoyltransferase
LREGIFDDIWIAPAAGDAGGALGAALFTHFNLLENPRKPNGRDDLMQGSLLGPRFSNGEIQQFLKNQKIKHHFVADESELLQKTVAAMLDEKVVGWFQDRMEFGPRALGARSIIGDSRSASMQSQMNVRIKFRESFRPFAPSVLAEDVAANFELDRESPYMLLVAPLRQELRCQLNEEQKRAMRDPDLRKRVNVKRSILPAITHVDMSARIQSVDEKRNGRYYRLICEFKRQTGVGVIINTSFNIRGEPIVCTLADAYRCFMASDMDVLVLENFLLYKTEQPEADEKDKQRYVGSFSLD